MELPITQPTVGFGELRNISSQNIGRYLERFETSLHLPEHHTFWATILEDNLEYDPFYPLFTLLYTLPEDSETPELIKNFFHYYKIIATSFFYDLGLLQYHESPVCMWRKQFFIDYLLAKIQTVITHNDVLIQQKDEYEEQLVGLSIYNLDISGMSEANKISTAFGDRLIWKAASLIQEVCEETIRFVRRKYVTTTCEVSLSRQGGDEFSVGFFGTEREIRSANRYFFDTLKRRLMTNVSGLSFSNFSVFGNEYKNLPITEYPGNIFQTVLKTENHLVLDELITELESGNIPEMNINLFEYIKQINKSLKRRKGKPREDELLTKIWSTHITKTEKKNMFGNYANLSGEVFEQEIKRIVSDNFIVYAIVKKCLEFDTKLSKKRGEVQNQFPFTKAIISTLLMNFDPMLGFIFDRGIIQFISEQVPGIEYVFIDIHIRSVNKLAGHAKGNDIIDEIVFQALQNLKIIPPEAHHLVSGYEDMVQVLKKYMIFGKQGPKFIVGIMWKKVPKRIRDVISQQIELYQSPMRDTPVPNIQHIPGDFLYAITSTIGAEKPKSLEELEEEGEAVFLKRFVYLICQNDVFFQEFREALLLSDHFEPFLGSELTIKTIVGYLFCNANKRKNKILEKYIATIRLIKVSDKPENMSGSFYLRLLFFEKELQSRLN
jgi:GGDEF domain-containing protein